MITAKSIIDQFKPHVNPYMGSDMLVNYHNDVAILWQAKNCAIIHVDGILEVTKSFADRQYDFWRDIKKDIENYEEQ